VPRILHFVRAQTIAAAQAWRTGWRHVLPNKGKIKDRTQTVSMV